MYSNASESSLLKAFQFAQNSIVSLFVPASEKSDRAEAVLPSKRTAVLGSKAGAAGDADA